MDDGVFREKSINRVNTPEDLNGYLKITNPPVWFVIVAVIVLVAGAIIWGCITKIETKAAGVAVSGDGGCVCYVSEQNINEIKNGTIVRIGDNEYKVTGVSDVSVPAYEELSEYCMNLGGFEYGENVYALTLDPEIKPGNYSCEIVLESVSPISFLTDSVG